MSNLSVRMKDKTINELDRIAKLLNTDRTTVIRKIVSHGIEYHTYLIPIHGIEYHTYDIYS